MYTSISRVEVAIVIFQMKQRGSLWSGGYITSLSKEDERELVKRLLDKIYDEVRLKNFGFHFIISYDCNLRCVYCYEDPILNGCACLPKCRITKEQVDKAYEIIIEKDKDKTGKKNYPICMVENLSWLKIMKCLSILCRKVKNWDSSCFVIMF